MVNVYVRQTLVQTEAPDAMRGRVAAVNSIFIGASNELGEFESGTLAALLGAVPAVRHRRRRDDRRRGAVGPDVSAACGARQADRLTLALERRGRRAHPNTSAVKPAYQPMFSACVCRRTSGVSPFCEMKVETAAILPSFAS